MNPPTDDNENLNKNSQEIPPEEEITIRWKEQSRNTNEITMRRAQAKMRHAQEIIERKLAFAQRNTQNNTQNISEREENGEKQAWRLKRTPSSQSNRSSPTNPSHQELLAVLRMLENKKITTKEAEKLLTAIEGNSENL